MESKTIHQLLSIVFQGPEQLTLNKFWNCWLKINIDLVKENNSPVMTPVYINQRPVKKMSANKITKKEFLLKYPQLNQRQKKQLNVDSSTVTFHSSKPLSTCFNNWPRYGLILSYKTWLLTKTGPIYFLKIAANLSNIPVSSGMWSIESSSGEAGLCFSVWLHK